MNQDKLIDLDELSFSEEVFKSDIPVLVDFWADWCSPCKQLAPLFEDLAEKYLKRADDGYIMSRKVKFCKADIQSQPGIVTALKEKDITVLHIPQLILFNKGAVVGHIEGFLGKEALFKQVEDMLSKVSM